VLRIVRVVGLAVLLFVAFTQAAQAIPPGQNGAIVVSGREGTLVDTYLMGPNGENPGPLGVDGTAAAVHPSGKSFAVNRNNSSARELYDFDGNLIRGLATKPISDFSPDGSLALSSSLGVDPQITMLDLETNQVTPLGIFESAPEATFTPDGNKIVYRQTYWSDTEGWLDGIYKANVDGSGQTQIISHPGLVSGISVSPDGTKIVYGGSPGNIQQIWIAGIDGSDPTQITSVQNHITYSNPEFSPDGTKIVAEKDFWEFGGDSYNQIVVMDIAGGGEHVIATDAEVPYSYRPHWVPVPDTLDLKLETRRVDDGDDEFDVVMRIRAGNQSAVDNLRFTDPGIIESSAAGFPEDEQSEVEKISGPDVPIPSRLEVNQESTHVWTYKVKKPGRVALFSELTARAEEDGTDETDGHTVIADSIPDGEEIDGEISFKLAAIGAMDNWLVEAYKAWLDGNRDEARRIVRWAKKKLSAKKRRIWLGSKNKLKISPSEKAFADRANISPELAAVLMPDRKIARKVGAKGYVPTERQIAAAFFQGYFSEIGRHGKRDIGKAWNKVRGGFIGSVSIWNYLNGDASAEERAQVEAMAMNVWSIATDKAEIDWESADGKRVLARYGHTMYKDHIGIPITPIRSEDVEAMYNDITLQTEDLQAQLKAEKIKLKNIYKGDNILKSVRKHGAATGDESYPWVRIGTDTMVGGGTSRIADKVVSKATGVLRLGKATGEVTAAGRTARKSKTTIKHEPIGSTGARPSIRDVVVTRRNVGGGETLDTLESIGGVPRREADIQREIIAEIEDELGLVQGQVGLALKPSSPLRKKNSVAKFELAKVKTGKPVHERLGMDPRGLSEPTFFNPTHPSKLPEWDQLATNQQSDLLKQYKKSKAEYKDWTSGKPKDPDLAKLSKATRRAGEPKITKPVEISLSHGRKVKAIFEEVPVPGTDTIRIRVKHYEVDGIVFVKSKTAKPMGPDLDAVAIYDAKEGARFVDRQLESKIVLAYRKKIAERTKAGERFHGAEHGMTLIMDDVPAGPGGSVGNLMQYGIPYLPEPAAYNFAKRIEPFVEMLAEEITGNVGKPFTGKFGQKVVNITSTDVYYGKLPVSEW
jgi:hypothetical protein